MQKKHVDCLKFERYWKYVNLYESLIRDLFLIYHVLYYILLRRSTTVDG